MHISVNVVTAAVNWQDTGEVIQERNHFNVLQILLFLQRFFHHSYTLPDVFVTYFTQISSIHNYNTRGKRNLYFTTTETETGKKALAHKGCILWNKLPEGLKTIKSGCL